jgi:hypothetical protein
MTYYRIQAAIKRAATQTTKRNAAEATVAGAEVIA